MTKLTGPCTAEQFAAVEQEGKIKNEAAARILQFSAQFGFTPSARTRLRVEAPPQVDDPMAALMKNMN